mgnify:CR=1 FL=1
MDSFVQKSNRVDVMVTELTVTFHKCQLCYRDKQHWMTIFKNSYAKYQIVISATIYQMLPKVMFWYIRRIMHGSLGNRVDMLGQVDIFIMQINWIMP